MKVFKHGEIDSHASVLNSNIPGKNSFPQKNSHLFIMFDAGLPNSTPHCSRASLLLLLALEESTVALVWPRCKRRSQS